MCTYDIFYLTFLTFSLWLYSVYEYSKNPESCIFCLPCMPVAKFLLLTNMLCLYAQTMCMKSKFSLLLYLKTTVRT